MPSLVMSVSADRTLSSRVAELLRFREVIKNFVVQDLKVKYRRSVLGFFWSLLNPLMELVVLSLVFSLMFRMNNLTLYILSGIIPWTFFRTTIDGCSMSIVSAESMLRRQYFPKLVFPLSIVIQNLITFALSLFVLLLLLGWAIGFRPSAALLFLPVSFVCIVCLATGLGALAAVVTVYFRDMKHLIVVFLNVWFYLTPIFYPLDPLTRPPASAPATQAFEESSAGLRVARDNGVIPHQYRFYFKLNPAYSVIEMFHRPIYHGTLPTTSECAAAVGVSTLALILGLAVFWRYEDSLLFAL